MIYGIVVEKLSLYFLLLRANIYELFVLHLRMCTIYWHEPLKPLQAPFTETNAQGLRDSVEYQLLSSN
jgi:hypothetical protein